MVVSLFGKKVIRKLSQENNSSIQYFPTIIFHHITSFQYQDRMPGQRSVCLDFARTTIHVVAGWDTTCNGSFSSRGTKTSTLFNKAKSRTSSSSSTKPSQPSVKLEDLFYVKEDYQRIEDENDLTIKGNARLHEIEKATHPPRTIMFPWI